MFPDNRFFWPTCRGIWRSRCGRVQPLRARLWFSPPSRYFQFSVSTKNIEANFYWNDSRDVKKGPLDYHRSWRRPDLSSQRQHPLVQPLSLDCRSSLSLWWLLQLRVGLKGWMAQAIHIVCPTKRRTRRLSPRASGRLPPYPLFTFPSINKALLFVQSSKIQSWHCFWWQ